ncbi:hypothetical protein COO91_03816 [Nostoc flagelliforme CCNUN1]|uniref:Uncharacterized protein n=1 Tax=Nostoc flagelliforme CCNUN1 TaxID=2038116 RepID=A0A2K8SQX0_9NOSO|nr:hypothetical protein COO91_03816 [Nostoc flagelliforme CCNUN1]
MDDTYGISGNDYPVASDFFPVHADKRSLSCIFFMLDRRSQPWEGLWKKPLRISGE